MYRTVPFTVMFPSLLILWFFGFTLAKDQPVTTVCDSEETVTFVKLDYQVSSLLAEQQITVSNKSLLQCSTYCSENKNHEGQYFPCAGFAYSQQRQACMLTNTKPIPSPSDSNRNSGGFLILPKKAGDFRFEDEDTGLYQKVCLRASVVDYLPTNVAFAFERFSNQIILGSTEQLIYANDLSHCLAACLEALDVFDISCRSVMYYYESGQCMLNSLDRKSSYPGQLTNETDNMHVDYFENLIVDHECGSGSVPQYVYLSNTDMINEHNFVIEKVSRTTCQHYCTSNKGADGEFSMCKSFAYQEQKRTCFLMKEQVSPRGNGVSQETSGVEVFEKICLTAPQTCVKTPAFERIPNHVLIGFAQIVMENIVTVELCLSECLASNSNMGFDCLSVMYYYDTNECILNFDSQLSPSAKPFFTNNTEDYQVDYYDNLCALRQKDAGQPPNYCPDQTSSSFIQFNNSKLAQYNIESFTVNDAEECLTRCDKVTNFTCNSADYGILDAICTLSHVDSRTSSLTAEPEATHYERHCLEGTSTCQAKPVSFDADIGMQLIGSETISVVGISLDECLSLCLVDPTQSCQSVNYYHRNTSCQLNNRTQLTGETVEDPEVDYYENKCYQPNFIKKAIISQSLVGDVLAAQTGVDIQTNCLYSSMKITMTSQQPFTGYMFAKNKFWSCGVQVQNSATAQLVLSFPTFPGAKSDCGVVEISTGKYSAIVVVTMNNLGIPGLVADGDRFFNITCDYTSSFRNKVTATGGNIAVNNPKVEGNLYPDGLINIPSPVQLQMRKFGNDQGTVHMVEVGEPVTLDIIHAEGFNRSMLDFFARQCNASRHYGPPPDPDPLVLIKDGCPTPSVVNKIVRSPVEKTPNGLSLSFTAFRFDGSNSVKITCLVDLCEGQCNPTSCNINGQTVASYGRKKRHGKEKIRKSETNSFVFTVVDRMPLENPELPINNKLERLKKLQNDATSFSDEYVFDASHKKQICLKKATFLGVFTFLCVLILCQVVCIVAYTARHLIKTRNKKA